MISLLLLSTDEVASQLEDPFPSLPLQDIVNTYERDINRIHKETRDISLAISEGRKTGGHALAAPPEVRLTTWLHDGGDAKEKEALLMRNGV